MMHVVCGRKELLAGLTAASRASAPRSKLPILQNVRLSTVDREGLWVDATNLEISITAKIGALVRQEGATTVPARLITQMISSMSDDAVELTLDKRTETLLIACGRDATNIAGITADEFPQPQTGTGEPVKFELSAALLRDAIDATAFAAAGAKDGRSPLLEGVLFEVGPDGDSLKLCATNSYRAATFLCRGIEGPRGGASAVIPAKSMVEVARMLGKCDCDAVLVSVTEDVVVFDAQSAVLSAQTTVGYSSYPNIDVVIPRSITASVNLADVAAFKSAVRSALLFSRDAHNLVRAVLAEGQNTTLLVTGTSSQADAYRAEVDAAWEGEPLEVWFDGAFMGDALTALDGMATTVRFAGKDGPMVLVGSDAGRSVTQQHIIMPMQNRG